MKSVDLNAKWNISIGEVEHYRDLPYDVWNSAADFASDEEPALYRAVFTKALPQVRSARAVLVITGACGLGEVFLNDAKLGALDSYAPTAFDVSGRLDGVHNALRIEFTSVPEMSDKYVGLGIGGDVKLFISENTDFEYGSMFVRTVTDGDKVYAETDVTIRNDGEAGKVVLECSATNMRGKRAGKKQRKISLRAHSVKTFTVRVRIARPFDWTPDDPYLYTMTAKLTVGDAERTILTQFGLVTRTLNPARGIYINGKRTLLLGAYVSHSDLAVGGRSLYCSEKRRFEALKSIGYNAVHFVECPSEAALAALDDVGMLAYVDIFAQLVEGKAPLDAHIFFDGGTESAKQSVLALRNHPCVALYGVADDVPECYDRHDGHAVIKAIADAIRSVDATRPVTVSTRELAPTLRELEDAGVRKRPENEQAAINIAREKDLFDTLTAGAFEAVDICGFNYLSPMYENERMKRNRLIVGSRTGSDRAFESIAETEKNNRVIGDFCDCGIDYPLGSEMPFVTEHGDFDAILDEKPTSAYKRILLGGRNIAYIAVVDPETDEPTHMWNWPRHLGQKVTVRVYTSGDVVALYLDGRLIGRRLAGRINKHIAEFETDYYPGTLEARCYYKGVECARSTLKSASSPKSIKLTAYDKSLSLARGDVGFVHIDVCDRDGNLVPYAMRQLTAQVTGARLLGLVNADPELRKNSFDSCPAYGGHALAVVQPTELGKAVVKITGDGLLSAKISFKVKD